MGPGPVGQDASLFWVASCATARAAHPVVGPNLTPLPLPELEGTPAAPILILERTADARRAIP